MVDNQQANRNGAVAWKSIGKSVQGATHKRSGLPNQDAIGWWPPSGEGTSLILAVADGHGSSKYFRSDQGSKLAVTTALKVLQDFGGNRQQLAGDTDSISEHSLELIQHGLDLSNPTVVGRMAEEQLPKLLTRRWLEAVEEHIQNHPLEPVELEKLAKSDPKLAATVKSAGAPTPVAYGTTLLTVVITDSFILYLQIGDGDILVVTDNEEVHRPIAADSRLLANETTSLCAKEAWRDFRLKVQPTIDSTPPALILVSTDGYANSFRDDDSFQKVGPDLLQMVYQYGLDEVQNRLGPWLDEASQTGSGDDVTLGVLKPLRDNDRDVMARRAQLAFTISEEAHKRAGEVQEQLASINENLTTSKQTVEERLKPLESSLGSIEELRQQIVALKKRELHYKSLEQRLTKLWRIVIYGIILAIVGEVLIHVLFRPRQSGPQTETTNSASTTPSSNQNTSQTAGTPSPPTGSNSNNAATNTGVVSSPTTPQGRGQKRRNRGNRSNAPQKGKTGSEPGRHHQSYPATEH
jgi:serine/threonine protein phosphatase PrpC